MENNYNETDAAIFAHKYLSPQMQQKYTVAQIEYLLDLIYEYYDANDDDKNDTDINIVEMTAFINQNISKNYCSPIGYGELEELLNADNAYMESIGLFEPENNVDSFDGDDIVNIENIIDDVYALLPQDLKDKYKIDDVFDVLCMECSYINNTYLSEEIDEDEMCEYIQQNAYDKDIEISIEDIKSILTIESSFLGEY
ncbi:MAG: hypothetical protein LBC68_02760 [Prevotellaceae bacterium]|jgi:hypothetical protein|nr:hypothetical protein [Prevotellaceae bacterium]